MAITEVFPNPAVKQVIFQIRYPNLFFLEDKIGDFQLEIMNDFPRSELINRTELFFATTGPDSNSDQIEKDNRKKGGTKIWNFTNDKGVTLNVTTNSLDISSLTHKTYNNEGSDYKFRDIIKKIVDSFLKVTKIPTIFRIGLRYIDEIPIENGTNEEYNRYVNSAFNTGRFGINDASLIQYVIKTKINDIEFNFKEQFINSDNKIIIFDFDGFKTNIDSSFYLTVADDIHTLISSEFEKTIKKPIIEYMNKTVVK